MRRLLATLTLVAGAVTAGCGLTLDDVPLPGLVDGPTYAVTIEFADALNLPVDAPVKLDGATVGQVSAVEAGDYVAEVEVALSTSVRLRESSRAEIRLTSPMGTAFVQLFPGESGTVLADGATLPVAATGSAPDVTDLLSALSTVVTGGSFADISTIIDQLNAALSGNAGDVRRLLRRLDAAVTDLNADLPRVDRLTASLDRLTTRLAGDLPEITRSLTTLTSLVTSLDQQREQLVGAMESLSRFDAVATPLTRAVREDLVAQLKDMKPVVQTLLAGRDDIDGVMAGLIAFAEGSDRAAPGDFANFDLTFLLDLKALTATGGAP
ncbi:MCE family protein [Nocardioides daeguensis]|uniref:MCE family protein n=1 Tax=Nocardioides daeguensis TaxID=908359 RepID=A0ABP6WLF4_9ACTN|nr:MlaD family protein [Nocardioides daeguensis]MBV6729047.1 MCE family protein [Nocardioides daeguensis]MCR1774949.1 MCE family protein [Nocardioides daeguensis]